MIRSTEAPAVDTLITAAGIERSKLLSRIPGIVHGITARVEGAGLAHGNVGYSAPRDRADAWAMRRQWMAAAGLDPSLLVVVSQTHGAGVLTVTPADAGRGADPETRPAGQSDAIVASQPGIVPMTLHADCMPVLLCHPGKRVVATIHAGWRGTVADVVGETVETMHREFAVDPAEIVAYLGPAIGGCCYEVGEDVVLRGRETGLSEALYSAGERWRFDLDSANRSLLGRAGLRDHLIESSGICTMCDPDRWFSHRGQGPATGRYGAFIALES